jgi:hypothetical protein
MEKKVRDYINHQTVTRPRLIDRLRVLFGAAIVVDSVIGVDKEVEVLSSSAYDKVMFKP